MKSQLENFDLNDIKTFDVKDYILKVISHWKLFLIMLLLGLIVAFFVNKRKQRIYSLRSLITVKEEQNPLFTSNTNIAFNWGGPSDKVETIISILKSRTHNEKVVSQLKYYIDYLKDGSYRLVDVYGRVPFEISLDSNAYNILSVPIKLEFLKDNEVNVSVDFKKEDYKLTNYIDNSNKDFSPNNDEFTSKYNLFEKIETSFCNFNINKNNNLEDLAGKTYYVRFRGFYNTVGSYQNIFARTKTKGTSLIELELKGSNKKKLEDYLNTTVEVLDKDQRDQKILYAQRTKNYIDTVFESAALNLSDIEKRLGDYRRKNNVFDLSTEGQTLLFEVSELDKMKQNTSGRLLYFNNL